MAKEAAQAAPAHSDLHDRYRPLAVAALTGSESCRDNISRRVQNCIQVRISEGFLPRRYGALKLPIPYPIAGGGSNAGGLFCKFEATCL